MSTTASAQVSPSYAALLCHANLVRLLRLEPPRARLNAYACLPAYPTHSTTPEQQGEFILVVDAPLSTLPRRPTDGSFCLPNTGPSKRTYKLNCSEVGKDLKPPTVGKDEPPTAFGAAGKNGNGVLVNRDGGFEFQRRLFCPRCQLQIAYETRPGEGQKGDATFILAGALSDVQNKVPTDAFNAPTLPSNVPAETEAAVAV